MRLSILTVGLVGLLLAVPLAARVSIGTALSLEDDRVLYRERRTEEWRDGRHLARIVFAYLGEGGAGERRGAS